MREHPNTLWRVETTCEDHPVFYVLACCLMEAAIQGEQYCGEGESVIAVELADGPLVVEGDDEGEEDQVEGPVEQEGAKVVPITAGTKAN